jgi:hypothetical protein
MSASGRFDGRRLELGVTALTDRGSERLQLGQQDRRMRQGGRYLEKPAFQRRSDRIHLATRQTPSGPTLVDLPPVMTTPRGERPEAAKRVEYGLAHAGRVDDQVAGARHGAVDRADPLDEFRIGRPEPRTRWTDLSETMPG